MRERGRSCQDRSGFVRRIDRLQRTGHISYCHRRRRAAGEAGHRTHLVRRSMVAAAPRVECRSRGADQRHGSGDGQTGPLEGPRGVHRGRQHRGDGGVAQCLAAAGRIGQWKAPPQVAGRLTLAARVLRWQAPLRHQGIAASTHLRSAPASRLFARSASSVPTTRP